jgi:hypothetical protein
MNARAHETVGGRYGAERLLRTPTLVFSLGLAVCAAWLAPSLAEAQSGELCQGLAARFAVAPDQLDPASLVALSGCITAELAVRIASPAEVLPESTPAPPAEVPPPTPTVAPVPRPVPPNVFPSQLAPSPLIAAPSFPDQAPGPAPTWAPQQYLGQWPPPAHWSTWPDGGWQPRTGM